MNFQEWVEKSWTVKPEPDLLDSGEDFNDYIKFDRNLGVSRVNEHFDSQPNIVICLSPDEFKNLPKRKDMNWPDGKELERWLCENAVYEWMVYDITTYIFVSERDAMAFKLRWL